MKLFKKGSYIIGVFIGMATGILGTLGALRYHCSWVCPAHVSDSTIYPQYTLFYSSNSSNSSNPSNHGGMHNLKTYLYKCGIWQSDTTPFSGTNPTKIDPDVFDLMTNGTKPLNTSTFGYTLDYQPLRRRGDTESSVKDIVLGNAHKNATGDWEGATLVMEGESCDVFPHVACLRSS